MEEPTVEPEEEGQELPAEVSWAEDTMQKFLDSASVDAVYGIPVQHGDSLIIPTAEILSGMAFGTGYGSGTGPGPSEHKEGEEAKPGPMVGGSGGGGGGGGRVLSRPVAVVIADPNGVRVEPVLDITKVALAALTAFGFMFGMAARMMNPRRALRHRIE